MKTSDFQELIWRRGSDLYRPMPWREDTRPYYVLVSELMLQQTQVDRVIPKFEAFIRHFPDEMALARATLAEVLVLWNGLGYNRRAKYLHLAAKKIIADHAGVFPKTRAELLALPGVGPGTAGALLAYAFNEPVVFIETNVRTVYFHHFFENVDDKINDPELAVIIEKTLDREHPREFYWALMDYGSWLKKNGQGRITRSAHYKKQTALKGSVREVRGQIIRLLSGGDMSHLQLAKHLNGDERFESALAALRRDGLVQKTRNRLHLTK